MGLRTSQHYSVQPQVGLASGWRGEQPEARRHQNDCIELQLCPFPRCAILGALGGTKASKGD